VLPAQRPPAALVMAREVIWACSCGETGRASSPVEGAKCVAACQRRHLAPTGGRTAQAASRATTAGEAHAETPAATDPPPEGRTPDASTEPTSPSPSFPLPPVGDPDESGDDDDDDVEVPTVDVVGVDDRPVDLWFGRGSRQATPVLDTEDEDESDTVDPFAW
jgi:hypothetical protein